MEDRMFHPRSGMTAQAMMMVLEIRFLFEHSKTP